MLIQIIGPSMHPTLAEGFIHTITFTNYSNLAILWFLRSREPR